MSGDVDAARRFASDPAYREALLAGAALVPAAVAPLLEEYRALRGRLEAEMRYPLATTVEDYLVSRR